MDRSPFECHPPDDGVPTDGNRITVDVVAMLGRGAMVGDAVVHVTVAPENETLVRSAESSCALDERVQDRLEIERRAADDLENIGSGSLLFQRLGEGLIAHFKLLEQPDVLDGDDCLVSKGSEQFNELMRERCRIF